MDTSDKITVMLVDDSSVIRGALTRIIQTDSNIEIVASVANGQHAITQAKNKKPDIMLLDIEMPVMDGLTALPQIIENSPNTKVIMCSGLTAKGADTTMKAMTLGAIECIVKPSSAQDTGINSEFHKNLISLINILGSKHNEYDDEEQDLRQGSLNKDNTQEPKSAAPSPPSKQPEKVGSQEIELRSGIGTFGGRPKILAIGSSTGGPKALFSVLKSVGVINIPIVITQHMPPTFTKILAGHITENTSIPAHEGSDGMHVEAGNVYVAPGGKHMIFEEKDTGLFIKLDDGPAENFCKPAVDPMLRSLIHIYGEKVLCVILTGMGSDGLPEARNLAKKGGRIIAQDKETSVVWGMPGAVATAGLCNAVLPLDEIGPSIKSIVG